MVGQHTFLRGRILLETYLWNMLAQPRVAPTTGSAARQASGAMPARFLSEAGVPVDSVNIFEAQTLLVVDFHHPLLLALESRLVDKS